jgi:hypothetical protein
VPRRLPLLVLLFSGLAGPCLGAVVPLRVTGSMSGAAEVTDHASGVSDTESFDAALRVSESEMSSTTTQRTRTASVGGQTAQTWSQCDAGTTEGGGLRAGVMSFASQGEGSLGTMGSPSVVDDVSFHVERPRSWGCSGATARARRPASA